jgi:hypothetical protein
MYDDKSENTFLPFATRLSFSPSYIVPCFPTNQIRVPIAIFCGGSDTLSDLQHLLLTLNPHSVIHCECIDKYEHLDFLWADDVRTHLFSEVHMYIERYTLMAPSRSESLQLSESQLNDKAGGEDALSRGKKSRRVSISGVFETSEKEYEPVLGNLKVPYAVAPSTQKLTPAVYVTPSISIDKDQSETARASDSTLRKARSSNISQRTHSPSLSEACIIASHSSLPIHPLINGHEVSISSSPTVVLEEPYQKEAVPPLDHNASLHPQMLNPTGQHSTNTHPTEGNNDKNTYQPRRQNAKFSKTGKKSRKK